MNRQPLISVIIPTYNEAKTIGSTLKHLYQWKNNLEIIVTDGGSTDGTSQMITGPAKIIQTAKGRANQMNAGAQQAAGDILLFLHSDTLLPPNFPQQILPAIKKQEVVGGAFKVQINHSGAFFYFASLGSNLRAYSTGLYFGDQAIFTRRKVFYDIGGFPNIDLMEDWEFSSRLKKAGKTVLLPGPVTTSARRWVINGKWRTSWLMHKIKLLYLLGVSPEKLRKMYTDKR